MHIASAKKGEGKDFTLWDALGCNGMLSETASNSGLACMERVVAETYKHFVDAEFDDVPKDAEMSLRVLIHEITRVGKSDIVQKNKDEVEKARCDVTKSAESGHHARS